MRRIRTRELQRAFIHPVLEKPGSLQKLDEEGHLPQTAHLCLWHPPELDLAREGIQTDAGFRWLNPLCFLLTLGVNVDHGLCLAHLEQYQPLPCSGESLTAVFRFIGGKARNMHNEKRERVITGTGGKDKMAVMGIFERGGKARTKLIGNRKKKTL